MMTVLLAAAFFTLGLYLTMRGGDSFVDAAARLAEASGVPRFVVGATLVSLCTTAPELTVSLLATVRGSTELAVGNAVGSAACNTGLILGVSALLAPAVFRAREAKTKGGLMLTAAILLGCFAVDSRLAPGEALGLLAVLFAFLAMNLQGAAQERERTRTTPMESGETLRTVSRFGLGAAAVVLGAKLMVDNGVLLARMLGIPEAVIGLTLVALGTSLPELMTALAAIRRHEGTLSAGNIVGANLIDLTFVLPACAAAGGGTLPVAHEVFSRDLPFTVVLMGIAMLPPMFSGRLRRLQGAALLGVYGLYLYCLAG
ncbi:MAG: calcium/sodium antiporter [Butyricicoccus sp.]